MPGIDYAFSSDVVGSATIGAFALNSTATASLTNTPVPPTQGFPVSIAGRNYMVDTSFEPYRREAFRHKSITPQRQSLHFTNLPDDGTVSTEGLWRREARDWALGAGQTYFDRKKSEDARFWQSKGINPWNQWNTTLLPDVSARYTSASSTNNVKAIKAGSYTYIADGIALYFTTTWLFSGTGSAIYASTNPTGTTGTTFTLPSTTVIPPAPFSIKWLSEIMLVTGTSTSAGVTTCTVVRGQQGTTAVNTTGTTSFTIVPTLVTGWTGTAGSTMSGTFLDMCTNGLYVYVVTTMGVWQIPVGASSTTATTITSSGAIQNGKLVLSPSGGFTAASSAMPLSAIIDYVGDRLMLLFSNLQGKDGGSGVGWANSASSNVSISGAQVFDLSQHTTNADAPYLQHATKGTEWIYTHPNPQWQWSGIAAGSAAIYFGGYNYSTTGTSTGPSAVFRTTVASSTGTSSTSAPGNLTYPVHALPLPADEYVTTIKGYLNYIFVGTNKGIRMCQTLNNFDPTGNSGDLKSGPLLPVNTQPLSQPVTAIVGHDRYIYWTWNNFDSVSSGLARLDLTTFIDDLAPAYASDLMIGTSTAPSQGVVTWLDWDPITDTPLISYDPNTGNHAVYTASTTSCVKTGYIDSGLITYGIPDYKNAVSMDTNVTNAQGTTANSNVAFTMAVDDSSSFYIGSYSGLQKKTSFSFQQQFGEQYRITTTLNAANNGGTYTSPTLNRWTLKALPGIPSGIMISAVILLFEPVEVDGQTVFLDPYKEYAALEALRQSQQVVSYVEGPFQASVTVDQLDWLPERRRNITQGGYHGDMVVYLKTVTG